MEEPPMGKRQILVVDDERSFTQFVKKALEQTGAYDVSVETDPKRALITAKATSPALIFLDIAMPDMDGGEVAAQLIADEELKDIPIIFLTGAASKSEVRDQGGMIGGRPFLAKPVKIKELVTTIERHIGPPSEGPTPTGFIRKLFGS